MSVDFLWHSIFVTGTWTWCGYCTDYGVILGNEIGKGVLPVAYALPALFAINSQVGCDFIPVALTLAEAEDETTSVGVPAMLFTRLLTGPMAVLIAYVFSFGL